MFDEERNVLEDNNLHEYTGYRPQPEQILPLEDGGKTIPVQQVKKQRSFFSTFVVSLCGFMVGMLIMLYYVPITVDKHIAALPLQTAQAAGTDAALFFNENIITNVAEKVGSAVVGISSQKIAYDFFLQPIPTDGVGSGFIFDERGYILTNAHVVSGATKITVTLADGRSIPGTVVGQDKNNDIAVVKINADKLNLAPLGDSKNVKVGQLAIAIGNPLGLELQRTVTAGIISATSRTVKDSDGVVHENMFQTDASINPGNSGGPLLNSKGQVIAINTAKITGAEGIGFAIPINVAKPIAEELIAHGTVSQPYIGITGSNITDEIAQYYNLPTSKGIVIMQIINGGPAAMAGLQPGDIITEIGGRNITDMQELKDTIKSKKVGDSIDLTVITSQGTSTVKVVLGQMP